MGENDLVVVGSPEDMWNWTPETGHRHDAYDWLVDNGFPVNRTLLFFVHLRRL